MSNKKKSSVTSYKPNYGKDPKWNRLKRKLRDKIVNSIQGTVLQFSGYKSFWHYKLSFSKKKMEEINHYLGLKPNYGAGIGHQMSNWNAGFYFASNFNKKFIHYSFSTEKWDKFLGFREGEILAKNLIKNKTYKVVRLPKFEYKDAKQTEIIRKIMSSYKSNILFSLETDQGYDEQFHTALQMSEKFFNAESRKEDKLIFSADTINIAIHIRMRMKIENDDQWEKRGLDNSYFSKILFEILSTLKTKKKIDIYLFSQGKKEEFPEFNGFDNIHYCMDMGPMESFLHMVYADILISSKSSFSYKPALISRGIKICPSSFWHGYPPTEDYILANNDSSFDKARLSKINF